MFFRLSALVFSLLISIDAMATSSPLSRPYPLCGEILAQNELHSGYDFFRNFERPQFTKYKRKPLDEWERKDISPHQLFGPLLNSKTVIGANQGRLRFELNNPLTELNEIKERRSHVEQFVKNKALRVAYLDLLDTLKDLDDFINFAVFGDVRAPYVFHDLTRNRDSAAADGLYFSRAIELFGRRESSWIPEMPPLFAGLTFFFAIETRRSDFGFLPRDEEHFKAVMHAAENLVSALHTTDDPVFKKLARILQYYAQPELVVDWDTKLNLGFQLFGRRKAKREHHNSEALRRAQARLAALVTGYAALSELDFLYGLAKPMIENPDEMVWAEYVDRPYAYLHVEKGHNPYVYATHEVSVPNSITIDDKNLIWLLVGPNKRGKSTFMKNLAGVGIAASIGAPQPAKKVVLTLNRVQTSMNVTTTPTDRESTFSKQALIAKNVHSNVLKSDGSRVITFIDEPFYGTTHEQQVAILEEYIRDLVTEGAPAIIILQNPILQRDLEGLQGVRAIHNTEGFTIEPGVAATENLNAPEILGEAGFDPDFVRRVRRRLIINRDKKPHYDEANSNLELSE